MLAAMEIMSGSWASKTSCFKSKIGELNVTIYIQKNVHEDTDVSRIRNLMTNAERLGEVVLKMAEDFSE